MELVQHEIQVIIACRPRHVQICGLSHRAIEDMRAHRAVEDMWAHRAVEGIKTCADRVLQDS